MLEKYFEDKVAVPIPKEDLWKFFSEIDNLPSWNPNFNKYVCFCSSPRHHKNVFLHFDLDRNAVGNFRIEEVEREEGVRLKFSVENTLFTKRNCNNFEITFGEGIITFARYLDFDVFDESKKQYWYKHFKDHHDVIIQSLGRLVMKDGVICKE